MKKGRSPYNFIVEVDERYNNVIDVDGNNLVVNTDISVDDFRYTNRVCTVVSTPTMYNTEIKTGDKLIVHHNCFRRWYDVRGNESEATGFLEDNTFFVTYDEIFAYNDNGWKALEGYCFIKPVPSESIWNTTGEVLLKGILTYYPKSLEHLRDHVVGFTPESEYEFNIDGEKVYRIFAHHVTMDYGRETKTDPNNQVLTEST